jgi:hypothetical protein
MSVDLANLPQDPDQLRLKLTEMAALLEQKEEAINTGSYWVSGWWWSAGWCADHGAGLLR